MSSKQFRFLLFLVLTFAPALWLGTLSFVNADKGEEVAPHTTVSDAGEEQLLPLTEEVSRATELESASFEGSGEQITTPILDTVPDDVPPVPMPGADGRTVIGADGRTRVNPTTSFPNRAVVFLRVTWRDGAVGSCTGWMIGPRTVATAGHCVYSHDAGRTGWARTITAYPGRNGSTYPYGSSTSYRLFSVTGWTSNRNIEYDYGAIQLNSTLGNSTGWFGYRYSTNNAVFQNLTVRSTGYPADKPAGTMWTMADPIRRVQTRRFFYAIDTFGGQSGSPVFHNYNSTCTACSVAIHTNGVGADPYGQYNSGTRITQEVFNNLINWRNRAYP